MHTRYLAVPITTSSTQHYECENPIIYSEKIVAIPHKGKFIAPVTVNKPLAKTSRKNNECENVENQ
jgi:hypothetical protein